jgi:hypothetical protein
VLDAVVDSHFFQVPQERGRGRFVECECERTAESEAADPVQVTHVDPSASAVDDPLETLQLLTWVNPIAAVEDELVYPGPDLASGRSRKLFVPPKVQGEVVIEVREYDPRGGVE